MVARVLLSSWEIVQKRVQTTWKKLIDNMGEGENTQNMIVMYEEQRTVKRDDGHR